MLQNILYIVMTLLMIIGLVSVVWKIALKLLSPNRDYRVFTVIPFEGHIEDAEYILRCERQFQQRSDKSRSSLVVADCGMDAETNTVCALLLKSGVIDGIYTPEALAMLYNG